MPGKMIPHFLMILLWSPLVFIQAQPSSLNCASDGMHRRQLIQDSAYQRRHREVERSLLQRAQQHLNKSNSARRSENTVYTIPVAVHLFYPPGTAEGSMSRPSHRQIRRSIERLSDGFRNRGDFSGDPRFTNAGIESADVGIEFRLAAYDPQGLPTGGIQSYATRLASEPIDREIDGVEVLDSLRRLSGWPSTRYLNIYVLPGLCNEAGDCPIGFSYQAGDYRVVVTDPFRCRDTLSFSLEMPAPLQVHAESTSSLPDKALGSIRVFVSGGTPPYAYQLENSSYQSNPLFENLAPGNYRYRVLDGNGCLWNDTAIVDLTTSITPPAVVESFRLYPNPAARYLHIDINLQRSAEGRLRLFDPLGRLIRQQRLSGSRQVRERWAVASLPKGLYLLRMELDGVIWARKMLVH